MTKQTQSKRRAAKPECVVGIDTGGTYTDGVLMDHRTRRVLASAKTLTTREDLAVGIRRVLDELAIESPSAVRLVGISSTLATNSIAEGKARRVGLVLIGYDPDLVAEFDMAQKFSTPLFAYFAGGHTSQGVEQAPPDIDGIVRWAREHRKEFDALAISGYFSPLDPSHERRVRDALRRVVSVPIVLGHQLSTKLDSIKRAATATLNASLVAVMGEFVEAVRRALAEKRIAAPLMIVKGDGSLMPYDEAVERPVETVLSGPAASAVGGHFLSGRSSALMIDVGGTTTDMAIVQDSQMAISGDGAQVGDVETAVQSARIRTLCIGCDSRIELSARAKATIGPDRVTPLCRLASWFESVGERFRLLHERPSSSWKTTDLQFWFISRPMSRKAASRLGPSQKRLMDLLAAGPLSVSDLLSAMEVHHAVQLNADALLRSGHVELAALTPTDLLHASGKMDVWDVEVARRVVECACAIHKRDPKKVASEVFARITATITEEAFVFLARQTTSGLPDKIGGKWMRWAMEQAIDRSDPLLSIKLSGKLPIVGIGAPADAFLRSVAGRLNTKFDLPAYHHVANAAGAVAGSIVASREALVYLQEMDGKHSYRVQIGGTSRRFRDRENADAYAREAAVAAAVKSARASGADEPTVDVETRTEGSLVRVMARAVGIPRLVEDGADRSLPLPARPSSAFSGERAS